MVGFHNKKSRCGTFLFPAVSLMLINSELQYSINAKLRYTNALISVLFGSANIMANNPYIYMYEHGSAFVQFQTIRFAFT